MFSSDKLFSESKYTTSCDTEIRQISEDRQLENTGQYPTQLGYQNFNHFEEKLI